MRFKYNTVFRGERLRTVTAKCPRPLSHWGSPIQKNKSLSTKRHIWLCYFWLPSGPKNKHYVQILSYPFQKNVWHIINLSKLKLNSYPMYLNMIYWHNVLIYHSNTAYIVVLSIPREPCGLMRCHWLLRYWTL